jgi:hypothetical protein
MNKIIQKYLDKFPNVANMTLAKKIYNENKLHFKDVDSIRSSIRTYCGAKGATMLKKLVNTQYLSNEKIKEKYDIPEGVEIPYVPYKIRKNNTLIFGDVHFIFQSKEPLCRMIDYALTQNIDSILILGDLLDLYQESDFLREPSLSTFHQEKEMTINFLRELRRIFPKCEIYYKFGNHEKRFEDYLKRKAPEIFGNEEFRLEVLLDLYNIGVHYIPEDIVIDMGGGLYAAHGHESKNGIIAPVIPARTALLKSKESIIMAHHHITSQVSTRTISGKILGGWTIGCMCGLYPKYRPQNDWNNGFAIRKVLDIDFWHIDNKSIIKGRVV